jgi:hypothetical protein
VLYISRRYADWPNGYDDGDGERESGAHSGRRSDFKSQVEFAGSHIFCLFLSFLLDCESLELKNLGVSGYLVAWAYGEYKVKFKRSELNQSGRKRENRSGE